MNFAWHNNELYRWQSAHPPRLCFRPMPAGFTPQIEADLFRAMNTRDIFTIAVLCPS